MCVILATASHAGRGHRTKEEREGGKEGGTHHDPIVFRTSAMRLRRACIASAYGLGTTKGLASAMAPAPSQPPPPSPPPSPPRPPWRGAAMRKGTATGCHSFGSSKRNTFPSFPPSPSFPSFPFICACACACVCVCMCVECVECVECVGWADWCSVSVWRSYGLLTSLGRFQ